MKIGRNDLCPCGSGKKFKKCHFGKIFTYQAEKFTILVKKNGILYKIFKIVFHQNENKKQSAIIISFPYHKNSKGLLSLMTFPKNTKRVSKLSLIPGGKVTSHKVKYTHWSDGNVHFSQDQKIYTKIKKTSDSLDKAIGHLFSIQIKGVEGFDIKADAKVYNKKEIDLDIDLGQDSDDSIKITGWWYDSNTIHPRNNIFTRVYTFVQQEGFVNKCFALQAPPSYQFSDKILFLCVRKEFVTKKKGTQLVFIGGFDERAKAADISHDLHFLAMLHPARNYNHLREQIGSIDFIDSGDLKPS